MKLQSIQVLRGFAALSVAFNHLVSFERATIEQNGFTEASLVGGLWENGFAGVDLFFVISGFIMVYVTAGRERGFTSAGDFYIARAARIYPLWWLFMAAMALVFLIVYGTPFHPQEYGKTDTEELTYILKSMFLIPQDGLPILGVGWTLIHEMYFYLAFGLFLLLPQKFLPALLLAWSVGVIASYAAGLTSTNPGSILHLITYPMTIEFILGAFAGLLFIWWHCKPAIAILAACLGAALFLAALIVFQNSDSPERGIWATLHWGRVIYFGIPAVLLVYGLASLERANQAKYPRILVYLGDISFALYLCHVIVFTGVKRLFMVLSSSTDSGAITGLAQYFAVGEPGSLDNILFAAVCLLSAFSVAALSFYLFEKPSLRQLTRMRRKFMRPIKYS